MGVVDYIVEETNTTRHESRRWYSSAVSWVLPALGVEALCDLVSSGVKKTCWWRIIPQKGGHVCEVETYDHRLLLEPVSGRPFVMYGDALYLRKQGKMYDGKGLLLGPNSTFKNIPILGKLL